MKFAVVFAFGLIGVGLLLIVLSGLWPSLFPGTSIWTEDKAARWAEVKDRLHNLSFAVNNPQRRVSMHSGPELGTAMQEFEQLKAEGELLKADFERAADRPRIVSKILKWSGISLAVIGIIGWYAVKQSA
jgi:hypothetical protein